MKAADIHIKNECLRLSKYGVQVSHTFGFGYIRSNSNHNLLTDTIATELRSLQKAGQDGYAVYSH